MTNQSQISTIGELFAETWRLYKQRALPIFAIILISTVLVSSLIIVIVLCGMFGGVIFTHVMQETTGVVLLVILLSVLLLAAIILGLWCQTAVMAIVVDEKLGIIESFQRGWEYLWPMTWVVTILSGILMTGFTFGVLPGFLFLVWFTFCGFILLEEEQRGMNSLLASREYVRGHGWDTFSKMAIVWLLALIAGIIPFLGQILSILLAPFAMLYLLTMYRELKAIHGAVELGDNKGSRIFWWIVTIIGLLLPIILLAALLYALLAGDRQWMFPYGLDSHGTSL